MISASQDIQHKKKILIQPVFVMVPILTQAYMSQYAHIEGNLEKTTERHKS